MASEKQIERFWKSVDATGDCWQWKAGKDRHGYGRTHWERKGAQLVHRIVWKLTHGEIPEGMHVLHRCDTPSCVNPAHLFLGTQLDNMKDKATKGRCRNGWQTKPGSMVRVRGPRQTLSNEQVKRIFALRSMALSQTQIGLLVGCRQTTVSEVLRLSTRHARELMSVDSEAAA